MHGTTVTMYISTTHAGSKNGQQHESLYTWNVYI